MSTSKATAGDTEAPITLETLERHILVLPLADHPQFTPVVDAHQLARTKAVERLGATGDLLDAQRLAFPNLTEAVAEEARAACDMLVAAADSTVWVLTAADGKRERLLRVDALRGDSSLERPILVGLLRAESVGVVVGRAAAFSGAIADLLDDVTIACDSAWDASLVSGSAPAGAGLFRPTTRHLIAPLDSPIEVVRADGSDTVDPGEILVVTDARELRAGFGALTLIADETRLGAQDIWAYRVEKARYWPRFRMAVPYNPDLPADVYGLAEPADIRQLLTTEAVGLIGPETAREARAWWSATLLPAPRVRGLGLLRPERLPDDLLLRGRFVGLPGYVANDDRSVQLAAASTRLDLPTPALSVLARLVENRWLTVEELRRLLPNDDPGRLLERLVRTLASVSLAEARSPSH